MAVDRDLTKPEVFISYTSHDRLGVLLSEGLAAALEKAGAAPFIDKQRLKPSAAWYPELIRSMDTCSGAVVLLTRNALTTKWVYEEAKRLSARWLTERLPVENIGSRRQVFPLFFVLLDDVKLELNDALDWKELLGAINYMKKAAPRSDELPAAGDPSSTTEPDPAVSEQIASLVNEIVQELMAQCVSLADRVHVPGDVRWLGELINILRKTPGEFYRTMDDDLKPYVDGALHRRLAGDLIHIVSRFPQEMQYEVGTYAAAERVKDLGDTVFESGAVTGMFARLDYFLTDPAAVLKLHEAFYASPEQQQYRATRRLLLCDQRTVQLYVQRGHMLPRRPRVDPIPIANNGVPADLLASVETHLKPYREAANKKANIGTVVLFFEAPLPDGTRALLEAACHTCKFPVVWVVYKSAKSDPDIVPTAYDELELQDSLTAHRCFAHHELGKTWSFECCTPQPSKS